MLDADRYYGEKNEARKLDMEITWDLGGKNLKRIWFCKISKESDLCSFKNEYNWITGKFDQKLIKGEQQCTLK